MKHVGRQDDATGFWSRRALVEHLGLRLAPDADTGPVGILSIRLDCLSAVNHLHGRLAGDELVFQFSERLRAHINPAVFIAKLDDNQIVVVLSKSAAHGDAESYARQLHTAVARRFTVGGEQIMCSTSIGVATGIPGQLSASELMRNAEHALSVAKEAGGNAVVGFTDDLAATFERRAERDLHLHDAIENGGLVMRYQPEVDLRTGNVVAVESIALWNHPTRGVLPPKQLIPAAEATGHAATLARRVLWLSCQQLHQWRTTNLASNVVMRIQLPLSPASAESLVTSITETLDHFELTADTVSLEFQENTDIHQSPLAGALIWLKSLGFGLTLENFGTGFSAFAGIKSLPIDTIKIDPSFVQQLDEDTANAAIIRVLVALCDELGLELVANGLQDHADAEALLELGCRRAQGPLLSPPLDADAATELLTKRRSSSVPDAPTHARHAADNGRSRIR